MALFALHDAARAGNTTAVAELVAKKVDLSLRDKLRRTALHLAAWSGHTVSFLGGVLSGGASAAAGARVQERRCDVAGVVDGAKPATRWLGPVQDVVKLLLAHGCQVSQPQQYSVRQGRQSLGCDLHGPRRLTAFLWASQANLAATDDMTALHFAAQKGHSEVVRHLLNAGGAQRARTCAVTNADRAVAWTERPTADPPMLSKPYVAVQWELSSSSSLPGPRRLHGHQEPQGVYAAALRRASG
jgi:ankyrin repeat protein